jgi:hypothetical protein
VAALPGLIADAEQLEELRQAADAVVERTRKKQWPYKLSMHPASEIYIYLICRLTGGVWSIWV